MPNYLQITNSLERHLLPPNTKLYWHDGKTEAQLKDILIDIYKLTRFENELDDNQRIKIEQLRSFLERFYSDYKRGKTEKTMTGYDLDKELLEVANFFKRRYALVQANPLLRRLFKRFGSELIYKSRIDVTGESNDIKGPGILAVTHHYMMEDYMVDAIVKHQIFWVGDPYTNIGHWHIRWQNVPVLKSLMRARGVLNVNRSNPVIGLRNLLSDSLHVLETGGLVGIMPAGQTDADYQGKGQVFETGHAGFVAIAQFAETAMKIKIPIVPIGISKTGRRIVINIGKNVKIPDENFDRKLFANELIKYMESLCTSAQTL